MQLGTLETAVEVGERLEPDVLALILDELRAIRNLLTHPLPIVHQGSQDYDGFHRFLDERRRIAAGMPQAPLPKGATGCDACRSAYAPTKWDGPEDAERKASGPPCCECDLPADARSGEEMGQGPHGPGPLYDARQFRARIENEKACGECFLSSKSRPPCSSCEQYESRKPRFRPLGDKLEVRCSSNR